MAVIDSSIKVLYGIGTSYYAIETSKHINEH